MKKEKKVASAENEKAVNYKAIEVHNLVKKYGSNYAVDDISFSIGTGEIVGFLGPNGAGKTTTMNVITGYLAATTGTVLVDGDDIYEKPMVTKKKIGFLPEVPPLYMEMTVYEYLCYVYELKGCDFNKNKHLREICEVVKLKDVMKRLIGTLSKGFKQRVGIAAALVGNPKIIILDEPTVGLDPVQIIEVRNLIRSLGKKHTVILSSHILAEVQAVCDRILIINNGKIIADEKTTNLVNAVGTSAKYKVKIAGPQKEAKELIRSVQGVTKANDVGVREGDVSTFYVEASSNIDIRKPLFYALAKKGWPLMGIESTEGELEDMFVKLISKK